MNNTKIKITNLYKIFGNNSKKYISSVRDGMSKDELLSKYNHVLGLDNINLNVEDQSIQVVMGLSCLLYTSPSPRDDPLSRMPSSA